MVELYAIMGLGLEVKAMKSNQEMLDFVKSVLKDVEKDKKLAIKMKSDLVQIEPNRNTQDWAKMYLDSSMELFAYDKQIDIIKFIISVIED